MQRLRNIVFNTTLVLNVLVLMLLVFSQYMQVPAWLQILGRMHPLVLHFPIVLVVLYVVWDWLAPRSAKSQGAPADVANGLLLAAAFLSALTAFAGLLLSAEEGYDQEALSLHKYSGSALSLVCFVWYLLRPRTSAQKPAVSRLVGFGMMAIVLSAGHFGAVITHGEDYLWAPLQKDAERVVVAMEDALVYQHLVQPVLEAKCIGCHSSKKAKGELIMETEALLLKGGKTGPLWKFGDNNTSLLLDRIHLPSEQKKHMPPAGKPQLTDDEARILEEWIKTGASFTQKVTALPDSSWLRQTATRLLESSSEMVYNFPAADDDLVKKLNLPNRVVKPLALQSPALDVSFFQSSLYNSQQLEALLDIKEQLVSLNLAHMPLAAADMDIIAQFTNLEVLNLSFTGLQPNTLSSLRKLGSLRQLTISGIAAKKEDLAWLKEAKSLKKLFVWNSPLKAEDLAAFSKQGMRIETGFNADTLVLQLTPPVLLNDVLILTGPDVLKLKHYVNGTTVRYTIDGSEPDSLTSLVYKEGVEIKGNTKVKARAFKPGWISSKVLEADFYRNSAPPDSILFFTQPDPSYAGRGGQSLKDGEKGDFNFKSGLWLGYRTNRMEAVLHYNKPVTLSGISFSTLVMTGSYIMPPAKLEVWGENSSGGWKLLGSLTPEQPTAQMQPYLKGYSVNFPALAVQKLKLVGHPVAKLPAWHEGKGQPGWLFVDELFVN